MCGIAGYLHFDKSRKVDPDVLKKMTDTISHRGPDGEGFYMQENLALGHRRLVIIDLSSGQQPMLSDDKKIVLVFNGEIYNYIELRNELIKLGHKFHTQSDTEVIINSYREWSVDCLNKFNGMWSFSLWDEDKKQLFLSRDRIGEKPLYYSTTDNSFIFGSEIKSLLAYNPKTAIRNDIKELYLTLGFVPAPYTFYENIFQLEPGKYLIVKDQEITSNKYWTLPDITESDLIKDKLYVENKFAALFNDAVQLRMRSDVSFGAFLSGGLDSSCIVGTMAKYSQKPVQTFTIGFNNKEFDESHLAGQVAERFGTNHHLGTVTSEEFDAVLKKILHQFDEPFGDSSAIPTGTISNYASKFVKMVLTGDGGDEVLSGYTIYQGEKFAKQYQSIPLPIRVLIPSVIKLAAQPLRGNIKYKMNRIVEILESSNLEFKKRLQSKLAFLPLKKLQKVIGETTGMISFEDFYDEVMRGCRFNDSFYKLMYFQHKVTLPGDMLTKVDRMSMAWSIETRVPFLDYRIIELLYPVHKNIKTKKYINKLILRNTIANKLLPDDLLQAPKRGFKVPIREWFKQEDLDRRIREILLKGNGVGNISEIEAILVENKKGTLDAGSFIWILLLLKQWLNQSFKVDKTLL